MGKQSLIPFEAGTLVPEQYYRPEAVDHCTNAWFFGRSADRSRANRIKGGKPLTVIGSPVIHDTYVEVDGDNYFDTGQLDTEAMTILVVARIHTPGDPCWLIGNMDTGGLRLVVTGTSNNIQVAAKYDDATPTNTSQMTPSGFNTAPLPWRVFIASVDANGTALYDMTTERPDVDAKVAPRLIGTDTMTIGGAARNAAYPGAFDVACVMTWDVRLDELVNDAAYQRLAETLSLRSGIVA